MINQLSAPPIAGGQFNTLVDNETSAIVEVKFVNGKGMEIITGKTLEAIAKKKMITQALSVKLIDAAKEKGEFERCQGYWNTYHCLSQIYSWNDKLFGRYCKNRICAICCGIRKAEIISEYFPELKKWEKPQFVTLTVKAVKADKLNQAVSQVLKVFRLIIAKYRKRNQRGQGEKLIGIKSLECNFNAKQKWYNPHLHIIVANEEMANILQMEWLKYWGKLTSCLGQKIKPVLDLEKNLIEVIKYSSKIFTEFDPAKKSKVKGETKEVIVYAKAIDNIFCALKPHHVFDRFGFNLPMAASPRLRVVTKLTDYKEWNYETGQTDWINSQTGEPLVKYKRPLETAVLLGCEVNLDMD